MSVVRPMFYVSFGTRNTMVAFSLKLDPRNGQYKVKKGSTFQNQNFPRKTCLSCPVLSQNYKNAICYVRQLEIPKNVFQKVTSWTLPGFLTIVQPNIKILLWNFVCVLFLCGNLQHLFRFFISPKFWFLWAFVFEKKRFEFWMSKSRNIKNLR